MAANEDNDGLFDLQLIIDPHDLFAEWPAAAAPRSGRI